METALTAITTHWRELIQLAITAKKDFQADADECMAFFDGPYDFLYGLTEVGQRGEFIFAGKHKMPRPSCTMTVNKVAEGVQLFGPTLYHRNPNRQVSPRVLPELPIEIFGDPNDPQTMAMFQPLLMQMSQGQLVDHVRSIMMEGLLNYLPVAMNLKDNSRKGIDQAIITGCGVMWHTIDQLPGSPFKLPKNEYDTVDNFLMDPDGESFEAPKWIARRRVKPVWEVETKFGMEPGTLRSNYESHSHAAAVEAAGTEYKKRSGKTNDLIVYWEIWSKMGLGALLRGISKDAADADRFGQYVYLAVTESCDYPLNLPEAIWENEEELYRRCQWETPFWCDRSVSFPWPCSPLAFHHSPKKVWPISHFKPAMGELKFINWTYSFLASGVQKRSRDFIVCLKSLTEELKEKVLEGDDLTLLEIESAMGMKIDEMIGFLKHPEMHHDLIPILERVERNFEKRTGLNELIYGQSEHQYRSAEEANIKGQNLSIRPDDMRNKVEDWMTDVARKDALAARWHMTQEDIAHIWGPLHASAWQQFVATSDIYELVDALEYRVEAGSTRKPNADKDIQDANQALQTFFAPFFQYAQGTEIGRAHV